MEKRIMDEYTVCLWPGAGYILYAFEVTAFNDDEALDKAVKKAIDNNYNILTVDPNNEKEIKELEEYYKEEMKVHEYKDIDEFISNYLNYYWIDSVSLYLHMDNTKIEKGWDLYNNSIKEGEE